MASNEFWRSYQPGLRSAQSPVGTKDFFDEVARKRYSAEPHIPEVVQFHRWSGRAVLEAGCGIGTDGARFAAAGAHYTGIDFSPTALSLARGRFSVENLPGHFLAGSATHLPFPDDTFDLVYSHGVIHHVNDTAEAAQEFLRVLKPGGTVLVMVYHRRSFNYQFSIMMLRRALAALLLLPRATALVSRVTGEPEDVLAKHKPLLSQHGVRYLLDRDLFLSNNTDGPGNPLSKAYTRHELADLFGGHIRSVKTDVRYMNLRLYPGGERLAETKLVRRLERKIGWHLYIEATKPQSWWPDPTGL